jgi:hypothetical protein
LYVNNPTNSAGQNSVITNRIGGSTAGKAIYSFDVANSHGYSMYLAGNNTALKFNNNWEGAGTDTMTLFNNGEVVISGSKFVIKGSNGASGAPTLHLRHANNRTEFIHNNSDLLYFISGAAGAGDTQDNWGIVANGRWPLTLNLNNNNAVFGGDVNSISINSGSIVGTSYILSYDAVYARSSYDTKIRSDSGGMYLEMGDIGNNNYLRFGAFSGVTYLISGAARSIYFTTNGFTWIFGAGSASYNGVNSIYWTNPCDQRIKENIKKANLQTCYENVKNINLYRFNYIDGYKKSAQHDKTQLGFVAQQVKQHFPKSVSRDKIRFEDKREVPDLSVINADQVNYTLFGSVKHLMMVVEKQSKRIKKLEEMLGIIDDDKVENDADEPYERIICDEVDIDTIEPSEPESV